MKKINILGAGVMGRQLSALLTLIGYNVYIWSRNIDNDIKKKILFEQKLLSKFLKIPVNGDVILSNDLNKIEENITIETLIEEIDVKNSVLDNLNFEKNIFTNTSSLKPSDFNKKVNVLHFCNPIHLKFCEINLVDGYFNDNIKNLIDDLKKISFDVIEVEPKSGFLLNKLLFSNVSNIFFLLEEENFKFSELKLINDKFSIFDMNIFKTIDIIGVDICLSILKNLNKYNQNYRVPKTLSLAISNGILGKKNKTSIMSLDILRS